LKKIIILAIMILPIIGMSQSTKIGVRAGLNYSWFQGPLEENESFGVTSGFHFGINYSYYFNDFFGLRLELLYNQKGTTQAFEGETYYILRRGVERLVDFGDTEYNLDISNAYFSLPISASVYLTPKIELFGGIGVDFLIGPTGSGTIRYVSTDNPDGIFFIQSLEYSYNSDQARGTGFTSLSTALIVEGERLDIPRIIGAYYFFDETDGNLFETVDFSLHAGVNYFINKGFFIGASINYGLSDVTRRQQDVSLAQLNPDNSFILRDDRDIQLSIAISTGFRF